MSRTRRHTRVSKLRVEGGQRGDGAGRAHAAGRGRGPRHRSASGARPRRQRSRLFASVLGTAPVVRRLRDRRAGRCARWCAVRRHVEFTGDGSGGVRAPVRWRITRSCLSGGVGRSGGRGCRASGAGWTACGGLLRWVSPVSVRASVTPPSVAVGWRALGRWPRRGVLARDRAAAWGARSRERRSAQGDPPRPSVLAWPSGVRCRACWSIWSVGAGAVRRRGLLDRASMATARWSPWWVTGYRQEPSGREWRRRARRESGVQRLLRRTPPTSLHVVRGCCGRHRVRGLDGPAARDRGARGSVPTPGRRSS